MIALSDTPVLTTERLVLRAPVAADWPVWRDFIMSERAQFTGGPLDEPKAWRAFGHMIGMWVLRGYGLMVFHPHDDDRALGVAGMWHQIEWPEAEIGWQVWAPEAEGKGFAYKAARAALDHAFGALGWSTAVSYIGHGNDRSVALARRLGASLDPQAAVPFPDRPCLVYRHPRKVA